MILTARIDESSDLRIDMEPEHRYPVFLKHFWMEYDSMNHEWDLYSELTVWPTGEMKPYPLLINSYNNPVAAVKEAESRAQVEFARWQKRAASNEPEEENN